VLIECVINISEGRDERLLDELSAAAGPPLLDRHVDPHHHRSVFTLAGEATAVVDAAHSLASATVTKLNLTMHEGAHPRLGVLDVVPFIPLSPDRPPPGDLGPVVELRDDFAHWLSTQEGVPSFLYGPLGGGGFRSLPEVRRHAFVGLSPDDGPRTPHPTAGATAVGARGVLVAYNVWVSTMEVALTVAPLIRGPIVRALGLALGDRAQVSCNLVDPGQFGPAQLYDAVTELVQQVGGRVLGTELVGLVPRTVLTAIPETRWSELSIGEETTIESRLERQAG
jgi:glutamate formiminotransferase / 5-formyltetrahydrofolate cyclo-ligase